MYRILDDNKEVWEPGNQLTHPAYSAPELLASKPNLGLKQAYGDNTTPSLRV